MDACTRAVVTFRGPQDIVGFGLDPRKTMSLKNNRFDEDTILRYRQTDRRPNRRMVWTLPQTHKRNRPKDHLVV